MGDFNIDLLKSESCDYTNRFLEILSTSSYIPLVLRPTRITQHTAALIDNIFTNDIETIESSTKPLFKCRTDRFQKSFFPSMIRVLNMSS